MDLLRATSREKSAWAAGVASNKMSICDDELKDIIEYTKLVLAYFEGRDFDDNYFGLVTSRLRLDLDTFEGFASNRKR